MTNADKIRAMTDEELVSILRCPGNIASVFGECEFSTCGECKLKWLKKEAKENAN